MDSVAPAKKLNLTHDGSITIATGKSRKEMKWKNREMLWSELLKRLSETTKTRETHAEYMKMTKSQQDAVKDVGGFVGGTLKGGRRKADTVSWRQVVTLDADHIKGDLWASIEMLFDYACCIYSTHKHKAEKPRLRFVFPLSRAVTPDEYQAVSRKIAADIGIDFFDDTTYQAHRLMYWPSTSSDGAYVFEKQDADWLDPDDVLNRYNDWTDPLEWPESSRQQNVRKKEAEKQGDPLEKPRMVGAFCRTYSITEAIETFLGDVYEEAGDGRFTYTDGSTNGGLVLYDDRFAFSHHGTDPVGGQLTNAFDLVRIHKFGIQDEDIKPDTPMNRHPSYKAMVDFAAKDENVRMQLGEEQLAAAEEEFGEVAEGESHEWLKKLERHSKTGEVLSTRGNIVTVLENDPSLKDRIMLNEFSFRATVREKLPWANADTGALWEDQDEDALFHYLESVYGIDAPGKVRNGIGVILKRHRFHPVQEYLEKLEWDGQERLDTLFIDYLGADDSEYVRAATRKAMAAAVKRVMDPGCKFDYMPVLVGSQGVGKSMILNKLGQQWFSDSLTTVHGKDAYEQLQGVWIMEMGELSATRKADVEAIKLFLSKQTDIFRVAYGRHTSVFPRQCVFFGTTNDREFLKDKTGNRRFWPIVVGGETRKDLWKEFSKEEINQIWAEAVVRYKEGEKLYLEGALEEEALQVQEMHTEESSKVGLIREYLEMPLPEEWPSMDIASRRHRIHGSDFGEMEEAPEGNARDKVCAMEIWVELFEGDPKQLNPTQAREINDILRKMDGWESYEKSRGRLRFGKYYGVQKAFVKKEN
ncbi:virulence-associated E family protein [Halobacillus shinanisalinarum]|uniref:Virulence-associated E family protein n=1 Tax=Halobacillus shinanisalinarum TaxID=2932258 RepID=A0ABY4GZA5_9BACI|nr:virulence-associated E family protein [Halobacillus shinanisalinarum]UOQ93399.1 virulence-associated E family protein [Halobacillus shinanisalinarum]